MPPKMKEAGEVASLEQRGCHHRKAEDGDRVNEVRGGRS